jgi:hypothetical protein
MAIVGERRRKKTKKHHPMASPMHYDPDHYEKSEDVRSYARAKAINADPERKKAMFAHAKSMAPEHKARMTESKAIVDMANKG